MADKEKNIKSMIKLLIANIDEFDSKFVTYKAKTIKALLQSTLQFIKAKEQELEELKQKQRSLEVSKELYDSYCETHCRANSIAIDLLKEFSFIEQQQIIPVIQEGIRILRFKRDKYKQAFDEIENIADDYNRVEKTSQYYRDGFDQIQDIINNIKEQ